MQDTTVETPPLERPRVSVIVPTRNRSTQLREALESIRALEGDDLSIELIVVDNGSTDDTLAVAAEYGCTVLHNSDPGAAASRNAGLRTVTTEFVALLDDDDVFLPGHIRPHVAVLRARPELAGVVGQVVLSDYDLQVVSDPYPDHLPDDGDLFGSFLGRYPQVGATVVRTSVRDTVGYFDPNMEGDEDWDWHLRLAMTHKVGFVPVPCMLFRQRPVGATADQYWTRLRNTRRVFFTNLRRARRSQRPGLLQSARIFLHHNGQFAAYFSMHARSQAAAGRRRAAVQAWSRAVLCSPPHAIVHLVHAEQWAA